MFNAYQWQEECLDIWFRNGRRGIAEVVTGAGKTHLAIMILSRLMREAGDNLRTFILVPYTALLVQWKGALAACGFSKSEIGTYYGKTKNFSKITLLVINSAREVLPQQVIKAQREGAKVFIIADECHHYGGEENSKAFHFLLSGDFNPGAYYSLGLSATLRARTKSILENALGPVIYTYSPNEAINSGIISSFTLINIATMLDSQEREEYQAITDKITKLLACLDRDYPKIMRSQVLSLDQKLALLKGEEMVSAFVALTSKRREVIALSDSRLKCLMTLLPVLEGKRIIIFMERVDQLEDVRSHAEGLFPGQTAFYHSKMESYVRESNLRAFKEGQKRIMLCCHALDEGLDVPSADVGIILSGTNQELQRIQRLGRILRKANGKRRALLYYLYSADTVERDSFLSVIPDNMFLVDIAFMENGDFRCYEYFELVAGVLRKNRNKISVKQQEPLKDIMYRGMLLDDYLRPPADLKDEIRNTKDPGMRDYLGIMLLLSYERTSVLPESNKLLKGQ